MSYDEIDYRRPQRNITTKQLEMANTLVGGNVRNEYLLHMIAMVQDLKAGQMIKAGGKLSSEDIGLTIEINGLSGVISDIRSFDERKDPAVRRENCDPMLVANGRMYDIKPREFYVLTGPGV